MFEKSVSAINVKPMLQNSVDAMVKAVVGILSENAPSVYLYGSVALDDFRLGWSDIDILVLTEKQITSEQAQRLVHLRREMTEREPQNPYYRLFEGGMLRLSAFLSDAPDTVVYWGTSGERVTARYMLNSLSKTELLDSGILLYGKDVRCRMRRPAYEDLREDIRQHYETVRDHGAETGKSLYSFGWLLDISRCIYTLRTGKIIPKTEAGEWAQQNALCPDPAALSAALHVRKTPAVFAQDEALQSYAADLSGAVQAYADVLQAELERHAHWVFGARENGVNYYDRPGAYLIAERNGKIAVVQTKRGFFLPGGGLENGESDEACICREVLEETGCTAQVGAFLCSAECYTLHEKNGPFHPIPSYYAGRIGERISDPKEADHRFVWLPAQDVRGRFYPEMQNWALEMYLNEKEQRGFCYE